MTEVIESSKNNSNGLSKIDKDQKSTSNYRIEIKWLNVILLTYIHCAAVYSWFLPKLTSSLIIGWTIGFFQGFGTTVAAHRYFTHKTFKANQKLKVLLMICQTMSSQEPILHWARDHRVHHKFTDTNADPYNSRRGFFFSHIGWLMCKKHPDVLEQGKKVDMSDLESDPLLQFQKKYFIPLMISLNAFTIALACYFGESFSAAWHGNLFKFVILLNTTWSVNSVAHLWGDKPYDKNISPTDTWYVGLWALGEGWHNYHHCFPWDYKTAELPGFSFFNLSTSFINFFAWLGWATELKTVPEELIKKRILRTGDGTHPYSIKAKKEENNNFDEKLRDTEHFWGWGDKEMSSEDMKYVKVLKS